MSEILVIAPPQDRAVTLEEARQQLRLDARDEDLLLGAKLDAAQAAGAALFGMQYLAIHISGAMTQRRQIQRELDIGEIR